MQGRSWSLILQSQLRLRSSIRGQAGAHHRDKVNSLYSALGRANTAEAVFARITERMARVLIVLRSVDDRGGFDFDQKIRLA